MKHGRNKFRAKPVDDPEHGRFDSQAEHRRFHVLRLMERAGEIRNLKRQPRFDITINGIKCGFYKGDFSYFKGQLRVIEDLKGFRTPLYRFKKKIVEAMYGIEILETA